MRSPIIPDARRELLLRLKATPDVNVTVPGFKGSLEPHQRVGASFMALAERCILGDFVGAGKTVESIAADLYLRSQNKVFRTLVVSEGGKRWDWRDEYRKFTDLPVYVIEGDRANRMSQWLEAYQNTGVLVTNYESLRGDMLMRQEQPQDGRRKKKKHFYVPGPMLQYLRADLIIFDEISVFKNCDTVLWGALAATIQKLDPAYCFGLSATPIEKTLEDLWSIMTIIVPGSLGQRYEYDHHFLIKKNLPVGRSVIPKVVGYKNVDQLATFLAPYYIRREKKDVVGDKRIHRHKLMRLELTSTQRQKYDEIASNAKASDDTMSLFATLINQQYACDTMAHFAEEGQPPKSHDSIKIQKTIELLNGDLKDDKVVIFSKFKLPLYELQSELNNNNIQYAKFYGKGPKGEGLSQEEREVEKQRFLQDPLCKVLLMTSAGERGHNLQVASYIIFINHIFNPMRIQQIIGRIDRPFAKGSNMFTCSIHMVAAGTFEDKIVPKLYSEADLMAKIFNATNQFEDLKNQQDSGEVFDGLNRQQLFNLIKNGSLPEVPVIK